MNKGYFYYIEDRYFQEFNDPYLMKNKEKIKGQDHDRPCFYAFQDVSTSLFWMIPISSQVEKFKELYDVKVKKYKICDTLAFGEVLGREKVFLIQNMCPIKPEYIKNQYIDKLSNQPVRIDGVFEKELVNKAKRVLALQRKGIKLIFPDVLLIESKLLNK